jgi:hypothetical protein
VRFLAAVTSASISGLTLIGLRIRDIYLYQQDLIKYYSGNVAQSASWIRYTPMFTDIQIIMTIIVVIILFALLFTVGMLFVWQLFYMMRNVTTIESFENQSIESLQNAGVIPKDIIYPYDLGFFGNAREILGNFWYLWFLPLPPRGDGISFKTNSKTPVQWPPREYYLHKKYPKGKQSRDSRKHLKRNPLVRRSSEGYIVKPITAEDRERMVQGTYEYPQKDEYSESSTDYDSLDESASDQSENETLHQRQQRIKQD